MSRPLYIRLLLVAVAVHGASPSLGAQTRDPVAEAQSLFDARQPATTVAGTLKREHTRTLDQSATILRTVGFTAQAIIPALRTEYTPSLSVVYGSLKQAGFTSRGISDAFASNGITLTCIDPQGFTVPCGSFGGTPDAEVTGQVSWSPKPEGQAGDKLYITATNLPPVYVRIGTIQLAQESQGSGGIIVRLPSLPHTGDLTIVRKSDMVSGLLQKDYRVVSAPLAWSAFATAASDGAVADMKRWIQGARVTGGCTVNGALANADAGFFTSSTGFNGEVKSRLLAAGAPPAVADAWDTAFRTAFTKYTSLVTIPALPLYPTLVTVAAPNAAPVTNTGTPLPTFLSIGAAAMTPVALAPSVTTALAPVSADDPARKAAIDSFANAVGARFALVMTKALVINLMGSGPVPKYAPPAVPAAPVEGGSCSGTGIVFVAPGVW